VKDVPYFDYSTSQLQSFIFFAVLPHSESSLYGPCCRIVKAAYMELSGFLVVGDYNDAASMQVCACKRVLELEWPDQFSNYRPRSRGDNTFGSIRVCVRPFV